MLQAGNLWFPKILGRGRRFFVFSGSNLIVSDLLVKSNLNFLLYMHQFALTATKFSSFTLDAFCLPLSCGYFSPKSGLSTILFISPRLGLSFQSLKFSHNLPQSFRLNFL